jgi:catechol 2,3-dioxygenase-like lactoylglutathione lyase family enzyme
MPAKVHVHMQVSDFEKSKEFYARFFGALPVKSKPGYAKFLPELGPLNLALSQGAAGNPAGPVNHMGVQVDSPQAVGAELARVKAAGLPVIEEKGVDCCHANQDKFWVVDPDGVRWEVYCLNHDLEEAEVAAPVADARAEAKAGAACCATDCCAPA